MLMGAMLDRAIDATELPERKKLPYYLGAMLLSALACVYGAFRLFPGSLSGRVFENGPPGASRGLGIVCLVLGAGIGMLAVRFWGRRSESPAPSLAGESKAPDAPVLALSSLDGDPVPSGSGDAAVEATSQQGSRAYDGVIIATWRSQRPLSWRSWDATCSPPSRATSTAKHG